MPNFRQFAYFLIIFLDFDYFTAIITQIFD